MYVAMYFKSNVFLIPEACHACTRGDYQKDSHNEAVFCFPDHSNDTCLTGYECTRYANTKTGTCCPAGESQSIQLSSSAKATDVKDIV